ncbi:hypothetical protein [Streptomyces sp. NBC_01304]|uniref:hypothetical protein n=1 Tax=Streptomyces sp. NBC_01304 TaxID=2903818 RepID=UPI002E151109|nr:hypothetical protein OG430_48695 [Streptomyces sp. NBC_01304]
MFNGRFGRLHASDYEVLRAIRNFDVMRRVDVSRCSDPRRSRSPEEAALTDRINELLYVSYVRRTPQDPAQPLSGPALKRLFARKLIYLWPLVHTVVDGKSYRQVRLTLKGEALLRKHSDRPLPSDHEDA